jgi:putative resolvase
LVAQEQGLIVVYARVSGVAQKPDLVNQVKALRAYCQERHIHVDEWMSDIGSGLNYKRKNFLRLMEMIELGQVRRLIIAHRDRLVRFGYDYFEAFCQRDHTEILVINRETMSPDQELVRDVLAIVSIFSARLHGLRSYRKALKDARREGRRVKIKDLKREYNQVKGEQFPWAYEVTKCAPEQEFANLEQAFDHYWRMRAEGTQPTLKHPGKDAKEAGFPHFKSKKRDRLSFYLANDKFKVAGQTLRVRKLGEVNMTEDLRLQGKILGAVISERVGRWFVPISVEAEQATPTHSGGSVGIDLGIKTLATLSDGMVFEHRRHCRRSPRRIKGLEPRVIPQSRGEPELVEEHEEAGKGALSGRLSAGRRLAQAGDVGCPRLRAHRPGRPERQGDARQPFSCASGLRRQLL